jgi:hypothetical protein
MNDSDEQPDRGPAIPRGARNSTGGGILVGMLTLN